MTSSRLPSVLALAAMLFALWAGSAVGSGTPVRTLSLGATVTVSGVTGSAPGRSARAVGPVVVRGRWGTGPWRVLKTTRTDSTGHYRFAITPTRRGRLRLQIRPPDRHDQFFVFRVV